MGSWKRIEDERGFLCYFNESSNTHQWDHPKFADVIQSIDDCNYVAYAKYRLALKFRVLQRCMYMEEVTLFIISTIFEKHRLCNNEGSLILETCDLEALLSDIFFASNKQNHTNIDVDFATELLINLLYNIFDSNREGKIQVVSTKILLGLLCNICSLNELHKYLFLLYSDHNNCITRIRLQALLNKILEIVKYVHEDALFGTKSMNLAVENCFQDSPGMVGITESNFLCWLNFDIPFLSWMPIILNLKKAETMIHSTKCTTCNTRPIVGLRYRCVKCLRYTQCQRCFLTGRISNSHKLSHSLREYSSCSSSNKKNFTSQICSLFCPKYADKNYSIVKPSKQMGVDDIKYQSIDVLCDVQPLSSPEVQLQTVIRQLESQNRELQQMLIFGNYNELDLRKYLEEYRIFMAGNIKKLKFLKNQINEQDQKLLQAPTDIYTIPLQQQRICKNSNLEYFVSSTTATNGENLDLYTAKSEGYHNSHCKEYPTPSPILEQPKSDIPKSPVKLLQNDLDEALAKLQQILANNFSLEDSLNNMDNSNLKYAVTEVEGMLTSIIDNVESSRCNSVLNGRTKS